jgi:hypothetical protein
MTASASSTRSPAGAVQAVLVDPAGARRVGIITVIFSAAIMS